MRRVNCTLDDLGWCFDQHRSHCDDHVLSEPLLRIWKSLQGQVSTSRHEYVTCELKPIFCPTWSPRQSCNEISPSLNKIGSSITAHDAFRGQISPRRLRGKKILLCLLGIQYSGLRRHGARVWIVDSPLAISVDHTPFESIRCDSRQHA